MPLVEIFVGTPGAAGHQGFAFVGNDLVDKEERWTVWDKLLDFVHSGIVSGSCGHGGAFLGGERLVDLVGDNDAIINRA